MEKKKFLIQFKYGKMKDIMLRKGQKTVFMSSPKKTKFVFIIDGDPVVGEFGIYGSGMHLPVSYCLYFVEDRMMDTLEKKLREERNLDLKMKKYSRIFDDMLR